MLKPIPELRSLISLVPFSGIQFLDFGFNHETLPKITRRFHEMQTPDGLGLVSLEADPETGEALDPTTRKPIAEEDTYACSFRDTIGIFLNKWVPLPVFRLLGLDAEGNEVFDSGPTNWARLYVTELAERDRQGNSHRVVVAFDTNLVFRPRAENEPYLIPTAQDAETEQQFALARSTNDLYFFLGEAWVDEWLAAMLREFRQSRGRRPSRGLRRTADAGARARRALLDVDRCTRRTVEAAAHQAHRLRLERAQLHPDPGRSGARRRQQSDVRDPDRVRSRRQRSPRSVEVFRARAARPDAARADLRATLREPRRVHARELRSRRHLAALGPEQRLLLGELRARRPRGGALARSLTGNRRRHRPVEPEALPVGSPAAQSDLAAQRRRRRRQARAAGLRASHGLRHRGRRRDPPDPAREHVGAAGQVLALVALHGDARGDHLCRRR